MAKLLPPTAVSTAGMDAQVRVKNTFIDFAEVGDVLKRPRSRSWSIDKPTDAVNTCEKTPARMGRRPTLDSEASTTTWSPTGTIGSVGSGSSPCPAARWADITDDADDSLPSTPGTNAMRADAAPFEPRVPTMPLLPVQEAQPQQPLVSLVNVPTIGPPPPPNFVNFEFMLRKVDGMELGVQIEVVQEPYIQALIVKRVMPDGAIAAWNKQVMCSKVEVKAVREGDMIVAINGQHLCQMMLYEIQRNSLLKINVHRPGP